MKDMRVQDVMTHMVMTLRPDDSIHEAARQLARNQISGAPVVEHNKVIGILTEWDILRSIAQPAPIDRKLSWLDIPTFEIDPHPSDRRIDLTVADIMTRHVKVIREDASIWEAATSIERYGVKRLPVLNSDGVLTGIVSRADLVRVMGRSDAAIRTDVIEALGALGSDTIGEVVVTCFNGAVTLFGRVDRKTTREIALSLAAHEPGVIRVTDRLEHEWDDTKIRLPAPTPDPRGWAAKA